MKNRWILIVLLVALLLGPAQGAQAWVPPRIPSPPPAISVQVMLCIGSPAVVFFVDIKSTIPIKDVDVCVWQVGEYVGWGPELLDVDSGLHHCQALFVLPPGNYKGLALAHLVTGTVLLGWVEFQVQ